MKKCPFCGEEIQEAAVKCKHCKEWLSKTGEPSQQPVNIPAQDERSVSSSNSHQKAAITVYAGFWRRFVAAIIDTIILAIGGVLIGGISGGIIGYALGASEGMVAIVYSIVLNWLYFTLLESSSKQATLGKMAIGIIVTDINGSRISFGKANGRYWGKIVSGIILLIGYVMAGFTQKKQALHDIMAGCLVIRDRETWCSRHYKGLSALLISIPIIGIIAAICIPAYLGVQERARNAQNEQASAPAPAPKPFSLDEFAGISNPAPAPAPAPSQRELSLIIPANVKGKWAAVIIVVTDKATGKTQEYALKLNSVFKIPNSDLKISVGEFIPDFKMDVGTITSASNDTNNPAVIMTVLEGNREIFKGWLYAKFPAIHPIEHPRYNIFLKEGIATYTSKSSNPATLQASVSAPEPQLPVKRITERVVTDKETGLAWIWEANLAGKTMTWEGANYFIESLNEQKYEGYNDWRLPTVAELKTLSKNMQSYRLDFQNVQKNYWTATFETGVNHTVASVDMNDGYVWYKSKSEKTYVLPVRVNQKK